MNLISSYPGRPGNLKLTPNLIALLASQLEKLVLEPFQEEILPHLLQGKSFSEVAAITGESTVWVLFNASALASQVRRPPSSPDAPQTARPPGKPPNTPLNAAAAFEFFP